MQSIPTRARALAGLRHLKRGAPNVSELVRVFALCSGGLPMVPRRGLRRCPWALHQRLGFQNWVCAHRLSAGAKAGVTVCGRCCEASSAVRGCRRALWRVFRANLHVGGPFGLPGRGGEAVGLAGNGHPGTLGETVPGLQQQGRRWCPARFCSGWLSGALLFRVFSQPARPLGRGCCRIVRWSPRDLARLT